MDTKNKNMRNGATVAEICVVLAIISVVSLIVVSFCASVDRRSDSASFQLGVMNDLEGIESLTEEWSDRVTAAKATIKCNNSGGDDSLVYAVSGEEVYSILFSDGVMRAECPNGEMLSYECKSVKSMVFYVERREGDEDFLLFCKVIFSALGDISEKEYTFCINSRIGEEV